MKQILHQDLYRYEGPRSRRIAIKLRYLLFTPGYQFTFFFRNAAYSKYYLSKIFWRICHRLSMWLTHIQIPVETEIGPGFRILHFGSIVVNPKAKIGKNFTIAQGALIGSSQGKRAGVPVIGDNVIMGANSIVIGGVQVGDFVLIATGAFVNFDVPSHSIVIGNPGKIIASYMPTNKYNVYPIE